MQASGSALRARPGARRDRGAWTIDADVHTSLLAMVEREDPLRSIDPATMARRGAGSDPAIDVRGIPVDGLRAFSAEFTPDEGGLTELLRVLERYGGAVELEESPVVLPLPEPISAEGVLWWNQSPASWVARARAPVVVERAE